MVLIPYIHAHMCTVYTHMCARLITTRNWIQKNKPKPKSKMKMTTVTATTQSQWTRMRIVWRIILKISTCKLFCSDYVTSVASYLNWNLNSVEYLSFCVAVIVNCVHVRNVLSNVFIFSFECVTERIWNSVHRTKQVEQKIT